MAKQAGIFQTRGSIGNVTFRETIHGFQVGMKSSLDKSKMAGNPRFDATREANNDFRAAAKGAKLVVDAMSLATRLVNTTMTFPRLQRTTRSVVSSDTVHRRGQKTMADGNMMLMKDFDFNDKAPLGNIVSVEFTTSIDRVTGAFDVNFPEFTPKDSLKYNPEEVSHYQLVVCGSILDFVTNQYTRVLTESAILPVAEDSEALTLEGTLTAASQDPIFLGVGIRFFKQDGTHFNTLTGASANAFKLVEIDF